MKYTVLASLILVCGTTCFPAWTRAHSQNSDAVEMPQPIVAEVAVKTLKAVSVALSRFERNHSNGACYTVDVYIRDGGGWDVAFIPKQPSESTTYVGRVPCGRGVTYEVSPHLKIVGQRYAR